MKKSIFKILFVICIFAGFNLNVEAKKCTYAIPGSEADKFSDWKIVISNDTNSTIETSFKRAGVDQLYSYGDIDKADKIPGAAMTVNYYDYVLPHQSKEFKTFFKGESQDCPKLWIYTYSGAGCRSIEGVENNRCLSLAMYGHLPMASLDKFIETAGSFETVDNNNNVVSDDAKKCEYYNQNKAKLEELQSNYNAVLTKVYNCINPKDCIKSEMLSREENYINSLKALKEEINSISKQSDKCSASSAKITDISSLISKNELNVKKAVNSYITLSAGVLSEGEKKEIADKLNIAYEIVNEVKDLDTELKDKINDYNCETLIGTELSGLIKKYFGWIQIAIPIMLILFGAFDFAKAVLGNDQDELKKAASRFMKRVIAGIAIFFLPMIITMLLSMDGIRDILNIKEIICGL